MTFPANHPFKRWTRTMLIWAIGVVALVDVGLVVAVTWVHRAVLQTQEDLASIETELVRTHQTYNNLKAEWAYLASPERLEAIGKRLLPHLQDRLPNVLPPIPELVPELVPELEITSHMDGTNMDANGVSPSHSAVMPEGVGAAQTQSPPSSSSSSSSPAPVEVSRTARESNLQDQP